MNNLAFVNQRNSNEHAFPLSKCVFLDFTYEKNNCAYLLYNYEPKRSFPAFPCCMCLLMCNLHVSSLCGTGHLSV